MDFIKELLPPALVFIGLGALMGILLAVAAKVFKVEKDEKVELIAYVSPAQTAEDAATRDVPPLRKLLQRGKRR